MIILGLLQALSGILISILSLLPTLPQLPDSILNGLNNFLDLIFNNSGLLGLFIPISTIKVVVPLIIVIINFDKIYKLVMWVFKKIPVFGVKD